VDPRGKEENFYPSLGKKVFAGKRHPIDRREGRKGARGRSSRKRKGQLARGGESVLKGEAKKSRKEAERGKERGMVFD